MSTASYQCWVLELPEALEEELCRWLDQEGARAYVREAHPPNRFFAYFDFGHKAPDPAHLKRWVNINLLRVDTLHDEDWLAKSRESFRACFRMRRRRDGGQPRCSARKGPRQRIDHTLKARDAAMCAAGPVPPGWGGGRCDAALASRGVWSICRGRLPCLARPALPARHRLILKHALKPMG